MTEIDVAPEGAFNVAVVAASLNGEHVADIVDHLNRLAPDEAADVLVLLPREVAIEILDKPDLDFPDRIIEDMPRDVGAALLAGMSADMAADVIQLLEEPAKGELMSRLDEASRSAIVGLLAYPENTAGSIMTTEFVSVPSTFTVGQTLNHIRHVERSRETVYSIYVLDSRTRRLIKAVSLRQLIAGDLSAPILSVAPPRRPVTVTALMDQEEVARLISKYDLLALPVVDTGNHVIGIRYVDGATGREGRAAYVTLHVSAR